MKGPGIANVGGGPAIEYSWIERKAPGIENEMVAGSLDEVEAANAAALAGVGDGGNESGRTGLVREQDGGGRGLAEALGRDLIEAYCPAGEHERRNVVPGGWEGSVLGPQEMVNESVDRDFGAVDGSPGSGPEQAVQSALYQW